MNDRLWPTLRKSFFAGLVVVAPLAASVAIVVWAFTWVTDLLLPDSLLAHKNTFLYRVVALGVFAFVVTAVGWVTRLVIGKRAVVLVEKAIAQVPLLNRIYGLFREVSHTMLKGQKTMFRRVVLVPYPHPEVHALAFVTSEESAEAEAKVGRDLVHVFVPASPPAHGFTLFVPRKDIIELDMSVADAMKVILSGGAVTPAYPKPVPPSADGH